MLCWFLLYNTVNQPWVYTVPSLLSLPLPVPHPTPLGCHRAPGWGPRVMQQLPPALYVTRCGVCVGAALNSSRPLLPLLHPRLCSPCVCFYFSSTHRFISTILLDSTYIYIYIHINIRCLFFWLTSLCIRDLSSSTSLAQTQIHSFLWLSDIPLFRDHNFFTHSSADGQLGGFHLLAVVALRSFSVLLITLQSQISCLVYSIRHVAESVIQEYSQIVFNEYVSWAERTHARRCYLTKGLELYR